MNAKTSVFVICVKKIIYLLLYHLHDCTFNKNFKRLLKMVINFNGSSEIKFGFSNETNRIDLV